MDRSRSDQRIRQQEIQRIFEALGLATPEQRSQFPSGEEPHGAPPVSPIRLSSSTDEPASAQEKDGEAGAQLEEAP